MWLAKSREKQQGHAWMFIFSGSAATAENIIDIPWETASVIQLQNGGALPAFIADKSSAQP